VRASSNTPPDIAIVADAFADAGLGHLSRSSAIAVALRARGLLVACHAYGAEGPLERDGVVWSPLADHEERILPGSVVVVDSYRLTPDRAVGLAASRALVVLHDFGETPRDAALVVSVSGSERGSGRWLTGLEYAALRPAFWGLPRRSMNDAVRRVLVTTGGSTFGSLASDLAQGVTTSVPNVSVSLVLGPHATVAAPAGVEVLQAPQSLLESLLAADLVVTTGGQTMLEAAATGTPCIALPIVENQRRQAARLAEVGAVHLIDSSDRGAASVAQIAGDAEARERLSRCAQEAVDGYGALRVAFEINQLLGRDSA
jgi:spore coat polysaccharide biosynthesis predicted glycosyltransferase SpsG